MPEVIRIGRATFNGDYLRTLKREEAVKVFSIYRKETVIEAHRIANAKPKTAKK
jgi:hypothetical protein